MSNISVNKPSTSSSPILQDKFNRDVEVSTRQIAQEILSLGTRVTSTESDLGNLRQDFDDLVVEWRAFYDVEWNQFINVDWPAHQTDYSNLEARVTALEAAP